MIEWAVTLQKTSNIAVSISLAGQQCICFEPPGPAQMRLCTLGLRLSESVYVWAMQNDNVDEYVSLFIIHFYCFIISISITQKPTKQKITSQCVP